MRTTLGMQHLQPGRKTERHTKHDATHLLARKNANGDKRRNKECKTEPIAHVPSLRIGTLPLNQTQPPVPENAEREPEERPKSDMTDRSMKHESTTETIWELMNFVKWNTEQLVWQRTTPQCAKTNNIQGNLIKHWAGVRIEGWGPCQDTRSTVHNAISNTPA